LIHFYKRFLADLSNRLIFARRTSLDNKK